MTELVPIVATAAAGTHGKDTAWKCPLCKEELPPLSKFTRYSFQLAKNNHIKICKKNQRKRFGLREIWQLGRRKHFEENSYESISRAVPKRFR